MKDPSPSFAAEQPLRAALLAELFDERASDLADLTRLAPRGSERLFDAASVLRSGVRHTIDDPLFRTLDRATIEVGALLAARGFPSSTGAAPMEDMDPPELLQALAAALALDQPTPCLATALAAASTLAVPSPGLVQVDAPLPDLLAAWAHRELCVFVRRTRPLASLGGPAVLHRAARCSPGMLGPYLSNLPRLVGDARGLLGLLARACLHWTEEPDGALLLALGHPALLHDLVERAADLGWLALATSLLTIAEQHGELIDDPLLWAVRDGALDTANPSLAQRAQALVAHRNPVRAVEWIVLAEVQGSRDPAAAEASLIRAIALAPDDRATAERLDALRTGGFDRFEPTGGFGSDGMRRRRRLAGEQARRTAVVAPCRPPA